MTAPGRLGPYRLERELGRGGQGSVWLAVDERDGRSVALKRIESGIAGRHAGWRREVNALARVGAAGHPGLARILDHGVEAGVPWVAMAWVSGVDLRRHLSARLRGVSPDVEPDRTEMSLHAALRLARARGPAVPVMEALAMVRSLCGPLAFLHGEGLVHRDLKPENVLVGADGRAVIVDLGLATRFAGDVARDTLEPEAGPVGTVWYVAPELLAGGVVDARADLYSLGCILHELLTGDVPFPGRVAGDVIRMHLREPPPPPSSRAPGIGPELDELVLAMLAKDPRDRPGYAVEVAERLGHAGAPEAMGGGPAPRVYLYRPALSGRDREAAVLDAHLARSLEGDGSLLHVTGPGGAGKTRLVAQLAARARELGMEVLVGCCPPDEERPLGGLQDALRRLLDRCVEASEGEVEELLGSHGQVLAMFEPGLLLLPGMKGRTAPVVLPPAVARARLLRALTGAFTSMGKRSGALLVVEDVQCADELTRAFVEHAAGGGRLSRARLAVVVTSRSGEAGWLTGVAELPLQPLPDVAVARMTADMLGREAAPPELALFLARQAEGNPFFVGEYLRMAVREGILGRDARRGWHLTDAASAALPSLHLPGAIRTVLERLVQGLGEDARHVAELGALVGRDIDEALLARLTGWGEDRLDGALRELLERQVLEEDGDATSFRHEQLRDVARGAIPPELLGGMHRGIAVALAERPPTAWVLAQRAHHWEAAGEVAEARRAARAAAEGFERLWSHAEAERLYRKLLELCPSPSEESVDGLLDLEAVLSLTGRIVDAEVEMSRALAEAEALSDRRRQGLVTARLAGIRRVSGRAPESLDLYRRALELSLQAGDRHTVGVVTGNLAICHHDLGHVDMAESLYREALSIHRETGNRSLQGLSLGNLANVLADRGLVDEARTCYEAALALHVLQDEMRLRGIVTGNLGNMFRQQGRRDQARALFESAVATHGLVGNRRFEGIASINLALIHNECGERAEAEGLLRRAARILRKVGDASHLGLALANLGMTIADRSTDASEARRVLDEAVDLCRTSGNRRMEGFALSCLGELDTRSGDAVLGERRIEGALAILREVGAPEFEAIALRLLARARLDLGAPGPAMAAAEESARLCLAVGDEPGAALAWCEILVARRAAGGDDPALLARIHEVSGRRRGDPFLVAALARIDAAPRS